MHPPLFIKMYVKWIVYGLVDIIYDNENAVEMCGGMKGILFLIGLLRVLLLSVSVLVANPSDVGSVDNK